MKQFICVIFSCLTLSSCDTKTQRQPNGINVSIVVDVTDIRLVYPDAESILPLYDFSNEEDRAATFRISTITDRELNPDIEFHLPTGFETERSNTDDDPDYRKKVIVQFLSSIRSTISEFNAKINRDTTFGNSECFTVIAKQLQLLAKERSIKGIALFYTDLQEKSQIFSCYSDASQALLLSQPEKVAALFDKTHLLPDKLKNITVCFVYHPISRDDDIRFMAMLKVYKLLLEPRGAKVIVKASNQNFEL